LTAENSPRSLAAFASQGSGALATDVGEFLAAMQHKERAALEIVSIS
jgi:hypothetical protein